VFSKLESKLVAEVVTLDPITGTQLGFSGAHNGRLPPTDMAERVRLAQAVEQSAASLTRAYSDMSTDEGFDAAIAVAGARGIVLAETMLLPLERNPGWYVSTALDALYGLLLRSDLTAEERMTSLLARLASLPEHFEAARRNLKGSAAVFVENALGDTEGAVRFCDSELRNELTAIDGTALEGTRDRALREALAALEEYRSFLKTVDVADGQFAIGTEAFDALLRQSHLLPFDSDELLRVGNQLVDRLSADLVAGAKASFGTGEWWTLIGRLADVLPAPEQLLETYRETLQMVRRFVSDANLIDLSTVGPVDVVPTPPFARTNLPFAAYVGAPPFGSGRAEFWVTPIDETLTVSEQRSALGQHHLGRMLVACIHEGFPGHHVEFSLAQSIKRPIRHLFRSTIYTEGWAFYCEHLVAQSGFLDHYPEADLLRLAFQRDQLWRALRIVIDVGLHCKGMSPGAAAGLLADANVMSLRSAESEIQYYCTAPTQPLSYMVGRLLFEQLIEKLRQQPSYSRRPLRDLHMEVLSHGPAPLALLARRLDVVRAAS
jgi:uncharacterized protein (DUF885 family)